MEEYIQVFTTTEKKEDAEKIAKVLVEKRLAGCIQIIGPITSTYWWKGNVEEEAEYGIILKTKEDVYTKLEARIKELHPYEVPMIVTHRIDKGAESYLEWIDEEVRPFNLR